MKMKWIDPIGNDDTKVLYLQIDGVWKPYNATTYAQPDNIAFGGRISKGLTTAQHLLKLGWTYERS